MYEQLGFEALSARTASAIFGVIIGVAFGVLGQRSRFCLRRSLIEADPIERARARSVWFGALAVAVLGTQMAVAFGLLDFSSHRFYNTEISLFALVLGGLLFGAGMVLTRGCASRLSVLTGTGNLRALFVLLVFAVFAHATLKGALAPVRTALADATFNVNVSALSGTAAMLIAVLMTALAIALWRSAGTSRSAIAASVGIGLLVPAAWLGTGVLLHDAFDPIAMESLSFASSGADWLFWSIAGTSIGAGFGVGFFGGVVLGSAASALIAGEFQWVSFESAPQTGRYLSGAALMGVGGVLAGGCTVGAGLAGMSTLGISATVSLVAIIAGAILTNALISHTGARVASVAPA
ncbi:MAG: YeeE/YedE family protein [Pseudomonadota bacterium]